MPKTLKPTQPEVPTDIRELLGDAPLLVGEDGKRFEALLNRLANAIDPQNFVEWFDVKRLADIIWEILRYSRFIPALITTGRRDALASSLAIATDTDDPFYRHNMGFRLLAQYQAESGDERPLTDALAKNGFDSDAINARSCGKQDEFISPISRLLASAEARKDKLLKEIDRRRDSLAKRMRMALDAEQKRTPKEVERKNEKHDTNGHPVQ